MRMKKVLTGLGLLLGLGSPAFAAHYTLFELADMYAARGSVALALDVYAQLVATEPKNSKVYEARAFYYLKLQRTDEALADFTTILAIAPKYAAGYISRGLVYSQLGQHERAKADFTAACSLGDSSGCSFAQGN